MLQSSHIVLSEMTFPDGTKRTGSIQSSNYEEDVSGFRIKWDGDVEFNSGTFRGSNLKFNHRLTNRTNKPIILPPLSFDNIVWEGEYLTACSKISRRPQMN